MPTLHKPTQAFKAFATLANGPWPQDTNDFIQRLDAMRMRAKVYNGPSKTFPHACAVAHFEDGSILVPYASGAWHALRDDTRHEFVATEGKC